ncbi:MAG: hypothetical protein CMJ18_22685 [Phycisphaeraceae bacterium]|nr:hypothetical protein [Phycisphaeraceae bacterium]
MITIHRKLCVLIVGALTILLVSGPRASCDIVLESGEPDPAHDENAMQVWLRADSGVVTEQGRVVAWRDRSNHRHDVAQPTSADRPALVEESFGGRPVVRFSGGGQHLKFSTGFDAVFDGSFTIFSLIAPDHGVGRDNLWFGLVGHGEHSRVLLNNSGKDTGLTGLYKAGGNSDNIDVVRDPFGVGPPKALTLVTWVVDAGRVHQIFVNGNPTAAATINGDADHERFSSGGIHAYLGAAQNTDGTIFPSTRCSFAGSIAEFIIYDGALNTRDRKAVEAYYLASKGLADESSPDYRPPIDRAEIDVRTLVAVNPWFPLDHRRWSVRTPDRPTVFAIDPPAGDVKQIHELDRKPAEEARRRTLIGQYEQELILADSCGVDALMIESMSSGIWWPVTPLFMQAADGVDGNTRVGIFLTGQPDGETPVTRRRNFVAHIRKIVEQCDRHERIWRVGGRPVVMLYNTWSMFPPAVWREVQAELAAVGKDCTWLMSGERVGWDLSVLAKYLPVMDGVAHYANYGLAAFEEKIANSMIPWMREHYPQKLVYPGVQQNYAQSWSFAGSGSGLTRPVRGMCDAAIEQGVDGLHFTNWSDFIENSRFVPSEMGDRALAELMRHYGWILQGKNPRDERTQPLFALSYMDSEVHGRIIRFELLAFPFRTGTTGNARIVIRDGKGEEVARSSTKPISMTELSEARFEFETADWPWRYTLTPEAEIRFDDADRETVVLRGPYMTVSPDREACKLARSVCSGSVLPIQASVKEVGRPAPQSHRLRLAVSAAQTCDEIRLVRNSHVVRTWNPSAPDWEEELTLQRGPVGFRAGEGELLPGVPPFDIYHLEAWMSDARRAWSGPLIVQNAPDAGDARTVLSTGVEISAPRHAFVTSRYSFDALVDRLVPDEGGFDFHGALGAGALSGKSRGYGYWGRHTARGVFHYYHGGLKSVPQSVAGGIGDSRCLSFDGTDDRVFFWSNVLSENSWTIAAHVRADPHSGEVCLWSTRSGGMIARLDGENRPVTSGWVLRHSWQTAAAQEPISTEAWHHVATTYDCRTLRLYVDGRPVAEVNPKGHVSANLPCLMVGCRLNYKGELSDFFKGRMDNLFITGRPMDDDEIAALARAGMSR